MTFSESVNALNNLTKVMLGTTNRLKDVEVINKDRSEVGTVIRAWNNTTDYKLSVNDLTKVIYSKPLNVYILEIRATEIVYNTIPIGIFTMDNSMVMVTYEGSSALCFNRIFKVLELIASYKFVPTLSSNVDTYGKRVAIVVLVMVSIFYSIPDSDNMHYMAKPNALMDYLTDSISENEFGGEDGTIIAASIFANVLSVCVDKTFEEMITILFCENALTVIRNEISKTYEEQKKSELEHIDTIEDNEDDEETSYSEPLFDEENDFVEEQPSNDKVCVEEEIKNIEE